MPVAHVAVICLLEGNVKPSFLGFPPCKRARSTEGPKKVSFRPARAASKRDYLLVAGKHQLGVGQVGTSQAACFSQVFPMLATKVGEHDLSDVPPFEVAKQSAWREM